MGEKGKKPSGEQQRRIPLQNVTRRNHYKSNNTFNEYDIVYE